MVFSASKQLGTTLGQCILTVAGGVARRKIRDGETRDSNRRRIRT